MGTHLSREEIPWSDQAGCPVNTAADTRCWSRCASRSAIANRDRDYFRTWRRRVGETGHCHRPPASLLLGYQINPSSIFYQWNDCRELFVRSMDAVCEASLFVMSIALDEGIDFMSDSSYGLEMTSPPCLP